MMLEKLSSTKKATTIARMTISLDARFVVTI